MDFTLYGGYSYSLPDGPEQFDNVRAACDAWLARWHSNGITKVDGVLWPTWGDMEDDDYAIIHDGDALSKREVIAYGHSGSLPFGWDDDDAPAQPRNNGETATFVVHVTLSTENGELPDNDAVERLIFDQMDDCLDDDTRLECLAIDLKGRFA